MVFRGFVLIIPIRADRMARFFGALRLRRAHRVWTGWGIGWSWSADARWINGGRYAALLIERRRVCGCFDGGHRLCHRRRDSGNRLRGLLNLLGREAGSGHCADAAAAYLNRQYRTVGVVAAVLFALLWLAGQWSDYFGLLTAVGFLIGAGASATAGYVGMNIAVRANVRTAQAAHRDSTRR